MEHLLRIGTSLGGSNLADKRLGTGHSTTVSGLPSSGPLYVSYWTRRNTGWIVNRVTFTMDVGSGGPRVWNCPAGDTNCLINAITIGNGSGNPEIIQLEAGTYTLARLDNGPNLLPRIIGNIKIEGVGMNATIIQSSLRPDDTDFHPSFGTFDVDAIGTLELAALSIMKGGTGISNKGTVKVRKVMISDNRMGTFGGYGTGIQNLQTGTMTLEDSTVSDYIGGFIGAGGGISNSGTMDITGSFFNGNNNESFGGIANLSTGIMTINKSIIANNRAGDGNAGVS